MGVFPHTGKFAPAFARPSASAVITAAERFTGLQPLIERLDRHSEDRALAMFRDELRDTKEIAWRLEATEAAVANGIANARERERS
jgi:putative protein kinase ArgK-like GTPase of G3E family